MSTLRRVGDEAGTAVLEFALVATIFITLVGVAWEYGRIFTASLVATNAAREGARFASTRTADGNFVVDVQYRTLDYLESGFGRRLGGLDGSACTGGDVCIGSAGIQVKCQDTVDCLNNTRAPGNSVMVIVPVEVNISETFVPGLPGPTFEVAGSAAMQLQ
jgi:hypothetical protein